MPVQGDIVGGFSLVRRLGAGGNGETWEAVRRIGPEFEQRVAIKLPDPQVLEQPEGRNMLRREASLAASLRHPNVAAVIDWNEAEGFIVCELVEGAPLSAVLREAPSHRLSSPLLVHVLAQVGRGLSHAHRRLLRGEPSPVVHRDMSPSNLVVDYDGNLKIVDFGIAKTVGAVERSKNVKGNLAYMAPEQASGQSPSPSFDQYALGVIAYEAACGVRPNDGDHDGQTLKNILNGRHEPIGRRVPELPSGLAEVIERMLALDPRDRFGSMDEVIEALEPFTPPLGTHRALAMLVQRAHPPETIVQEDGHFISRPVTFEVTARKPDMPRVRTPLQFGINHAGPRTPRLGQPPERSESSWTRDPVDVTEPPPFATGPMSEPLSPQAAARSRKTAGEHVLRKRWHWLAAPVAGLLAALLGWGLVEIIKPRANAPAVATATTASAVTTAPASPGGSGAGSVTGPGPVAAAEAQPPAHVDAPPMGPKLIPKRKAAKAETGGVLVRVKVFPWGRVWIDGAVRGAVPPILQARVRPGMHTISVGQEAPVETRTIEVKEGETPLVSFDLNQ